MKIVLSGRSVVVLLVFVLVAILLGFWWLHAGSNEGEHRATSEAIIERAIQTRQPALCDAVTETTRPGPTDAPEKITGKAAIKWCAEQVRLGHRVLGG